MKITTLAAERTTAATDVALCALAIVAAVYFHRLARPEPWKRAIWTTVFGLAALTAGLGAILHGFDLPHAVPGWIWIGLLAPVGLTVAMLGVSMIYEQWGLAVARRALPVLAVATLSFYATRVGIGTSDVSFRLYLAAVMLFTLGGYGWLALRRRAGATWMTAGILVSLIGIGVHLRPQTSFTLGWTFDHNGIYHLVQMVGLAVMTAGVRASLRSPAS